LVAAAGVVVSCVGSAVVASSTGFSLVSREKRGDEILDAGEVRRRDGANAATWVNVDPQRAVRAATVLVFMVLMKRRPSHTYLSRSESKVRDREWEGYGSKFGKQFTAFKKLARDFL
jgi:hypothetical protein